VDFGTNGLCDQWNLGPWDFGTMGLWDHATLGTWDCQNLGPLHFGTIGIWDRGTTLATMNPLSLFAIRSHMQYVVILSYLCGFI
jgi:hypothetical protein